MIVRHNRLALFFGNADTRVFPEQHRFLWQQLPSVLADASFNFLQKELNLDKLIFAHQVHGTSIIPVTSNIPLQSFKYDADGLYTSLPASGLGILTADCTPVIVYNTKTNTVAIIHAGWRGTLQGIIPNALSILGKHNIIDYIIYIGPGARQCCYIIDATLAHTFSQTIHGQKAVIRNNDSYFLDIPNYIISQLHQAGIANKFINTQYAACTICDISFCSYRRQKESAGRQITVVSLQP